MNSTIRRVLVGVTSLLGVFVGIWAAFFPIAFYDSFPGIGFGPWVSIDGPYNEHLVRDVGALYLALAGAGVYAVVTANIHAARAVGIAWVVFSIPHFTYHLHHLEGMTPASAVAELVSLASTIVLGALMLWQQPRGRKSTPPLTTQR